LGHQFGYHKINACCQHAHSSIEAMREILAKHPELQGGTDVTRIELQTHRLGMTLTDTEPVPLWVLNFQCHMRWQPLWFMGTAVQRRLARSP
jgi:hypothetical protein